MRRVLSALTCLIALPAFAQAQTSSDISAEIGASGLAATEARLAALPAPDDADRFALGGVRFLGAIEASLQARWRTGMNASYMDLPVLRLPIEPNPAPEPMAAGTLSNIFTGIVTDMEAAREALTPIPDDSDFGLEIAIDDIWFDVNANGTREEGEALATIAGTTLLGWRGFDPENTGALPVIRFDVADARWLTAYTHLLSAFSEVVLAYDPTAATEKALSAAVKMEELTAGTPMQNAMDNQFGIFVDRIAILISALEGEPDTAHTAAAHRHLLDMIGQNRIFWDLVRMETDNVKEWVPNDGQQSALGIEVPQGTGEVWLDVLGDAEALLSGDRLVPYWRVGSGAGLNLNRMFLDPAPIHLVDWIQGAGALPYLEQGERVSTENWRRFEDMFWGDAILFVAFLN